MWIYSSIVATGLGGVGVGVEKGGGLNPKPPIFLLTGYYFIYLHRPVGNDDFLTHTALFTIINEGLFKFKLENNDIESRQPPYILTRICMYLLLSSLLWF